MDKNYVICGASNIKNNDVLNELIKKCDYEYDVDVHDLDEESLAMLVESLNTIPFLTSHKIVVCKFPKFLYKPDAYDSKIIEAFKKYLLNPIDTTTFIILINTFKDMDQFLKQLLEKTCTLINSDKEESKDLKTNVIEILKREGYKYEEEAINELLARCEKNSDRIEMELAKLMLYKASDHNLKLIDVKELVSKDLEDNIFDLVNAVVESDRRRAIEIYNDLMVLNEDESKIIALLINKFNEMYQTKSLLAKGYNKNDIAQIFDVKPGRAYYMVKACQTISLERIKRNINSLLDIDYRIKSGQLDKSIALELFLLK